MRRVYALIAIVVFAITPDILAAQLAKPAGVVDARHLENVKATPPRAGLSVLVDSTHGHPWRWVGTGAIVGGATCGITAAVSASRNDDGILSGPAIGFVAAAGAFLGGLVGGLAYLISH